MPHEVPVVEMAASLMEDIRLVNLFFVNAANKMLLPFDLTFSQAQVLLFLYQKPEGRAETCELRALPQYAGS